LAQSTRPAWRTVLAVTRTNRRAKRRGDELRTAWEQRSEWPLILLSLIFLAAYAWPILDPHLPDRVRRACETASLVAWAAFAADYGVRLTLAADRWTFVRHHVVDLAAVALPVLRPLRALRIVAALNVLNRRAEAGFRGRVVGYTLGAALLLALVASLAMLDTERGKPGANISSFGDAIWWALATMTTVGYGDRYPTTGEGRLVAAGLMVAAIALLAVITASFASWLIERVRGLEQSETNTQRQLTELAGQVRRLNELLALRNDVGDGGGRSPRAQADQGDPDESSGLPRPRNATTQ
jgi:voltage-gated potassium channel